MPFGDGTGPRGGEDRERGEEWVEQEWGEAEAGAEWAVPGPAPAPGEDVSARLAELPLPIRLAFPALITNARNVELPWTGNK